MTPRVTPFFLFYRGVSALAAPLVWRRVAAKLARHGVPVARQRERLGHATLARPNGRLIWFHAASVGESVSTLGLIDELLRRDPELNVLVTSGTATSAEILARRLPDRACHQFAPLDRRDALERVLDHWRPDALIFVESELWPHMIVETARRGVPLALINARMSRSSLRSWARFDHTARYLLAHFRFIRTQDDATRDGLRAIIPADVMDGDARNAWITKGPNLKAMAPPLPVDGAELNRMRQAFAGPVWLAASTHDGEETKVIEAHIAARAHCPDLRLILVPRHPDRADDISAAIAPKLAKAGLSLGRRSQSTTADAPPGADAPQGAGPAPEAADVYMADTLGETGLWFALCPLVFLGGSLSRNGGHNPYEPARAGAAVLFGPHVANFAETYADFLAAKAAIKIANARSLGREVGRLMTDDAALSSLRLGAQQVSDRGTAHLAFVADEIAGLLGPFPQE